MSRRRPLPTSAWVPVQASCTGRGTHGRVLIAELSDMRTHVGETGRIIPRVPDPTPGLDSRATRRRRRVPGDEGYSFAFPCPACGRNAEVREERLGAALADLYALEPADARAHDLDVSYLD